MITYFKNKNHKSKKRPKSYKALNGIFESVNTIVIIGATLALVTLSITGVSLNILPISAGRASTLSLGNEVLHRLIINQYNKNKKLFEKDHQTIQPFDKYYRKSLQDNVIDKSQYESLCHIFTK